MISQRHVDSLESGVWSIIGYRVHARLSHFHPINNPTLVSLQSVPFQPGVEPPASHKSLITTLTQPTLGSA